MIVTLELSEEKLNEIEKEFDVIIIGGGCAGYSSALFCARYGLKTLIITENIGGNLNEISIIENYPSLISIEGYKLAKMFKEHAEKFGVKTLVDKVIDVKIDKENFLVFTSNNKQFVSKVLIFCTGSKRRKLGVKGENLRGVSYCAECDAPLFKDKIVGVVGGGNTAFHDALVLSKFAKKVYLIHRREEFRAEKRLIDLAMQNEKIEILTNKIVKEIRGEKNVEEVVLEDVKTKELINLKLDGLFIAIGLDPNSELAQKIGVELNEKNEIIVDKYMRTNIKGVLAAGDVTNFWDEIKLIITSAAQGAIAAYSAFKYIKYKIWK